MKRAVYLLLAVLCLAASLVCLAALLVSCSGHSPKTILGNWLGPLSLLGLALFFNFGLSLFKKGSHPNAVSLRDDAIVLPRKVLIFIPSFLAATLTLFLFMSASGVVGVKLGLKEGSDYTAPPLAIAVSISIGILFFKGVNKMPNRVREIGRAHV
jgi:hypothetical protein